MYPHRFLIPVRSNMGSFLSHAFAFLRQAWGTRCNAINTPGDYGQFVWNFLTRACQRLDALMVQWEQGTLPPPKPKSTKPKPTTPKKKPETPPMRCPRGNSALVEHGVDPNGAAFIIYRAITLDPKVEAFFKEVPKAAGILRSLARPMRLHMPDWLKLPKRPRKPKPKAQKPRASRPQHPPEPVEIHGFRVPDHLRVRFPGRIIPKRKKA
jgi:hypothetical protein